MAQASLSIALAFVMCACASLSREPETGRPRSNEPSYPVILGASDERRDRALAFWTTLLSEQGAEPNATGAPELQPVTATLRALPATASTATLRLPQVGGDGANATPTEEETRESLRRFIAVARALLGVLPEQLSLVERADTPAGTKRARYQQKPFRYPLRAGYGWLDIEFTNDRRVVGLSSTAIPDTERIERALASVRPQLTAPDAVARVAGRSVAYTDADGREQSVTVAAGETNVARELVVYPRRRADDGSTLAFHVAWEVAVGGASPLLVYVDAVTGDIVAATQASAPASARPATLTAAPPPNAPAPATPRVAATPTPTP